MPKKYIIANWKMNPTTLAEAEDLLAYIDDHLKTDSKDNEQSLVICPPFVFLEDVSRIISTSRLAQHAELGAQDIALADSGAWTGEVSGHMLKRLGVQYVIIGHSERRWKIGESDDVVNKKLKTSLANDLTPIVCIGERTRQNSVSPNLGGQDGDWQDFIRNQVTATFAGLTADDIGKCLIAYEPVWAISSNPDAKPDSPESALESISVIQEFLVKNFKLEIKNLAFLYGGSVTDKNARDFLSHDQISGVLVGGASLNKEEFVQILNFSNS